MTAHWTIHMVQLEYSVHIKSEMSQTFQTDYNLNMKGVCTKSVAPQYWLTTIISTINKWQLTIPIIKWLPLCSVVSEEGLGYFDLTHFCHIHSIFSQSIIVLKSSERGPISKHISQLAVAAHYYYYYYYTIIWRVFERNTTFQYIFGKTHAGLWLCSYCVLVWPDGRRQTHMIAMEYVKKNIY